MKGFRDPTYNERLKTAAAAKKAQLTRYRARRAGELRMGAEQAAPEPQHVAARDAQYTAPKSRKA